MITKKGSTNWLTGPIENLMSSKSDKILGFLGDNPGHTAREIAEALFGRGAKQQMVYSELQSLCQAKVVVKFVREDGLQAYSCSQHAVRNSNALYNYDKEALRATLNVATRDVLKRLKSDPNDRMHSWTHCFRYFHQFRTSPTTESIDLAALHLGFYLASYGMYRGGTRLLRKDYKFLVPIVRELIGQRFVHVGVSPMSVADATSPQRTTELLSLCDYLEHFLKRLGLQQQNTGTLVTKILLGTWCNVPAFDTAFRRALKTSGFGKAVWGPKNFKVAFASLHSAADVFQDHVQQFHAAGFAHYPAIRVIDAIFWHAGGGDQKTDDGVID